MTISFTLPLLENKPKSVKDQVFSILVSEHPLTLIELLNEVKHRYAVSVSFQAVRKAALQLMEAKVLTKEGRQYSINREWIHELTRFSTLLQRQYFADPKSRNKISVGKKVTVYTFSRLIDLDVVWNTIIIDSFASDPKQPKIITFSAMHFWFVIATLAQETGLMKRMSAQGIASYYLLHGKTSLDQWTVQFYRNLGVSCKFVAKPEGFEPGLNIGTYGDFIMQTTHPKEISERIDRFFKKYKRIEDANLPELVDIATAETSITFTVIKDPMLAKTFREKIMEKF